MEQEQELERLRGQAARLKEVVRLVRGWYGVGDELDDIEVLNMAIADLVRYETHIRSLGMALKNIINEEAGQSERRKQAIAAALRRMDNEESDV